MLLRKKPPAGRQIIYSILATVAPPQFIEQWLGIFGLAESDLPEVPKTNDVCIYVYSAETGKVEVQRYGPGRDAVPDIWLKTRTGYVCVIQGWWTHFYKED